MMTFKSAVSRLLLLGLSLFALAPALAASRVELIRQKLDDPSAGIFIAAHRGCHNASPRLALAEAPENSRSALEHCVLLGVDMMELDVRRAADGTLVVIHDATVDRTTNGHGKVAEMTLAQLKGLRLRQNFGGKMSPELGTETVSTLAEMLDAAKGRIMLNLDIKEDIYAQTIAEARSHDMIRYVLVKSFVDQQTVEPVSDRPMFADVPYMPIVGPWRDSSQSDAPAQIVTRQLAAVHRPAGVELVFLPPAQFQALRGLVVKAGVRLWANSLTSVGVISVIGMGGDLEALRTSGKTWGALFAAGIDTIQTDEPGPLLDYLEREGIKH
ncbi:glycerophosphodiester phosphodiesterase [Duganella sp. FT50W]|uniref:Glycerophosphodiester phosphodiesterase n=1 Tax=Duganella lactea TaxID=2692173 RepID=A0A6L8MLY3_9BURK|nr:glycerophosphodiester phosphodiesterase family protein [Duganella lactea]MYM83654.1 glycerophosphodiester phosphodiesterase [Duganella lactea]